MVRPQKDRIVSFDPDISYFKPRGIPMIELEEVRLTVDEREAIRLADLREMSHEEAGRHMGVSRATFGRILQKARRIIADALIHGKAINIGGGCYKIAGDKRVFVCNDCAHKWEAPRGTGRPNKCPECEKENFYRTLDA
jgi:predicted DNA-binding protein (UPF0251 family)